CMLVRVILSLAAAGVGAILPGTIRADAPRLAKATGAAAFFVVVFFVYTCKADSPIPPVDPTPTPIANPQPTPTFHDEDQNGNKYVTSWSMDPACKNPIPNPAVQRCIFTHTQQSFAGDNTPYDHWRLEYDVPGPVVSVQCDPTGTNEFNQVKGDNQGE